MLVGKVWVNTAMCFAVQTELDFKPGALEEALRAVCLEEGVSCGVEITRTRRGSYNVLASDTLAKDDIIAALSEIERKTAAATKQLEWLDLLRGQGD